MSRIRIDGHERAKCDAAGCKEVAPDPGAYMIEHQLDRWPGWNSLGWICMGGTHYCPKHAKPEDRFEG